MTPDAKQQPWAWSLQVAADVCHGLEFLHASSVLHRDLKSPNVLLDEALRAKICDFGLAKVRSVVSALSVANSTAVTTAWSAPEVFGLRPKYSEKSDVFSIAVILWELLTKKQPYADVLDPAEVRDAVRNGEREEIPANCPGEYRALVEHCWAQKPDARPSASDAAAAVEAMLAQARKFTVDHADQLTCKAVLKMAGVFDPAGTSPLDELRKNGKALGISCFEDIILGVDAFTRSISPATKVGLRLLLCS